MTQRQTFPLKTAIGSRDALTYYGHLVAQAEAELGEHASRMASFALCWIAGDVTSRGGKSHTIDVEGLASDGQILGNWSMRLRIIDCPKMPIEIFRQQFLAQDGKDVVSLALPFLEGEDTEDLDVFCLFQLAQHCTRSNQPRARYILRDSQGHEIRVELRQRRTLPSLGDRSISVASIAQRIRLFSKR